jgi:hypothetical protein
MSVRNESWSATTFFQLARLTVGAKDFAPFYDCDIEQVAVDEAPKVQMWMGIDRR